MKKLSILFILLIALSISVLAQDTDTKKDVEAIKKVIQTAYVEGLQNEGDVEKIDNGFHPGFKLLGIGQGNQMWEYPIYTWKESVLTRKEEGKLPKKDDEQVSIKFLNVDVTGTAAVAKIEFYVGKDLRYVDYLSLYKFEDGWKIVNKIYYEFPKDE